MTCEDSIRSEFIYKGISYYSFVLGLLQVVSVFPTFGAVVCRFMLTFGGICSQILVLFWLVGFEALQVYVLQASIAQ